VQKAKILAELIDDGPPVPLACKQASYLVLSLYIVLFLEQSVSSILRTNVKNRMSKLVVTAAKKEDPRIWALITRDGHCVYLVPLQKKQSLSFSGVKMKKTRNNCQLH
jgi:hypothetical protein